MRELEHKLKNGGCLLLTKTKLVNLGRECQETRQTPIECRDRQINHFDCDTSTDAAGEAPDRTHFTASLAQEAEGNDDFNTTYL